MDLHGRRVYLGGPLDDPAVGPAEFEAATRQLESWGARVLSPYTFGLGDDDEPRRESAPPIGDAIDADAAALRNADLVVVLPGGDHVAETMAGLFGLPLVSLVPAQRATATIPVPRQGRESLPSEASSPASALR